MAFDGTDSVIRISDGLAFCNLSYQTLTVFKRDNRRCCPVAFRVGDDDSLAAFHNGDT